METVLHPSRRNPQRYHHDTFPAGCCSGKHGYCRAKIGYEQPSTFAKGGVRADCGSDIRGVQRDELVRRGSILNRLKAKGWAAHITSTTEQVTSMNGVTVQRQKALEFATQADVVLIGSGIRTREIALDADLLSRINLDPSRQLTRRPMLRNAAARQVGPRRR
jgi:hypothetical protein